MKITESTLRSVIKKTIREMSHDAKGYFVRREESPGLGGINIYANNPEIRNMALACIKMAEEPGGNTRGLFNMCIEICQKNPSMAEHCLHLCKVIMCDGEAGLNSCCECIQSICECEDCCAICIKYCGR